MKKKNIIDKERYWTFIMYPESMPKDWKQFLTDTGLKVAISPLHNKDINEADGEIKKEHYHVLLLFPGPTTYSRVEKITNILNGTIPKRVISPVGIIRYFTHKDNPEKAQYDEREIQTIGGLDINEIDTLSESQIEQIKIEILAIIKTEQIKYYSNLIDYLNLNKFKDHLKVASKNTIFFNTYLKTKNELTKDIVGDIL